MGWSIIDREGWSIDREGWSIDREGEIRRVFTLWREGSIGRVEHKGGEVGEGGPLGGWSIRRVYFEVEVCSIILREHWEGARKGL